MHISKKVSHVSPVTHDCLCGPSQHVLSLDISTYAVPLTLT